MSGQVPNDANALLTRTVTGPLITRQLRVNDVNNAYVVVRDTLAEVPGPAESAQDGEHPRRYLQCYPGACVPRRLLGNSGSKATGPALHWRRWKAF